MVGISTQQRVALRKKFGKFGLAVIGGYLLWTLLYVLVPPLQAILPPFGIIGSFLGASAYVLYTVV